MTNPWDPVVLDYEQLVEPFTSLFIPELLETSNLDSASLLDVACGSGAVALYAQGWGAKCSATDFSQCFCDRVAARSNNSIPTFHCSGEELPPDLSNSFDLITSSFGVIFFPSPSQGLKEMNRCLKPGGTVIISAWGNKEETAAFRVFPDARAELNLTEKATDPAKARADGSPASLNEMLVESGFENVVIRGPVTRSLEMGSAELFFERFAKGSPGAVKSLASMTEEERAKLKAKVMELATARSNAPPPQISLDASAYFATATKPEV